MLCFYHNFLQICIQSIHIELHISPIWKSVGNISMKKKGAFSLAYFNSKTKRRPLKTCRRMGHMAKHYMHIVLDGPCTGRPTILWSIFGHITECGHMGEVILVMQMAAIAS